VDDGAGCGKASGIYHMGLTDRPRHPQWTDPSTDRELPLGRDRSAAKAGRRTPHRAATTEGADVLRKLRAMYRRDDGMTTAEYAVGLIAAVAFAGILYKVVTSGTVLTALTTIVKRALSQG
jgi:Flp pilus assembly pilin Flp